MLVFKCTGRKKQGGNQHLQAPCDRDSESCEKCSSLSRKNIYGVMLPALMYTTPPTVVSLQNKPGQAGFIVLWEED